MGSLDASDRRRRDAAVVAQVALHCADCIALLRLARHLQSSNSFEDVGS
jgi:hypothetical protein